METVTTGDAGTRALEHLGQIVGEISIGFMCDPEELVGQRLHAMLEERECQGADVYWGCIPPDCEIDASMAALGRRWLENNA